LSELNQKVRSAISIDPGINKKNGVRWGKGKDTAQSWALYAVYLSQVE
jgi:hypothetical protein